MKRTASLGLAVCLCCGVESALSDTVIGSLDSTRAGDANMVDGAFTDELRSSLLAHFAGVSILATPTLTDEFFASIDVLVTSNAANPNSGITPPLSAAEQTALLDFIAGGGKALLLADGFFPFTAQNLVETFSMTIQENGSGIETWTVTDPLAHPASNGPFGVVPTVWALGYGFFTDLGPHAQSLATDDVNHQPVLTVIPSDTIAPGSGRVLITGDATIFADAEISGLFSVNETLFLNSMSFLFVPEPPTVLLTCISCAALLVYARGAATRRLASTP